MDIKGKVALVTGVSRGMGKQMALRLARHGVHIVGVARTVEKSESEWPGTLKETEAEIRALGVDFLAARCDLMVRTDVERMCQTALDKFGRVDFVVNNARYVGPELFDPFLQFEIDTWQRHIAVDLLAPVIISKACLPSMIQNKGGIILNVTASVAHHEIPGMPGGGGGLCAAYPTMKAALDRFTMALAKEAKPHGIVVIAFDPGAVMNERFALEIKQTGTHGLDLSIFHTLDVPAAACEYLCCACPEPMRYSGAVVVAKDLCQELNLH
jgi:NAD(P)-dependent dehydrogenase (short-subunit alcohol dehydrogenase family)